MSVTPQTMPAPGSPIPSPPDFPVHWEVPGDELLFWERESMHMPLPTTTADAAIQARLNASGARAFAGYHMPIRLRMSWQNCWAYQAVTPVSFDHQELAALGAQAEQALGAAVATLWQRWEEEWLPEVQAAIAAWDAFDTAGASDTDLAGHLRETLERFSRLWEIHFQLVMPMLLGVSLFDDFFRGTIGGDTFDPYRLLQGHANKSLEADHALWQLARRAAASPALRQAIEVGPPGLVRERLVGSTEAEAFAVDLTAYLDTFGRRADAFVYPSLPSWREDPSMPVGALVEMMHQDGRDLVAEHDALATERERLLTDVRVQLDAHPPQVQEQFQQLLRAATNGSVLQEDHNYWIDGFSIDCVRRVLLAVGERLVERGLLESRDDVFHLGFEESSAALTEAQPLAATAAQRRERFLRFGAVVPPPLLGTFPPGPPPDDAITRTVLKMFGAPPPHLEDERSVSGLPGSPGCVRGRARVLRSLADGPTLERGEILVTTVTSPPWTPLFAIAAAVVTDTGGILSHCAIVAREYMIPAVVGTKSATGQIVDGQLIEVDGDAGVVRIIVAS